MKQVIWANSNLGNAQINGLIADIESSIAQEKGRNPFRFGVPTPNPLGDGATVYSASASGSNSAQYGYLGPASGAVAAVGASTTADAAASQPSGGESNQMDATSASKRTRDEADTEGNEKDADGKNERKKKNTKP